MLELIEVVCMESTPLTPLLSFMHLSTTTESSVLF